MSAEVGADAGADDVVSHCVQRIWIGWIGTPVLSPRMSLTGEGRIDVLDRHGVGGDTDTWSDPWRVVRVAGLIVYTSAFVAWFRSQGIIIDRISVMLAVVLLLVVAHLGRPWYRWRQLGTDLVLYAAMWFAYEETRGAADRLGMPLQVESVRNIDRVLFAGADPTVWLQGRFYEQGVVRWYDMVASISYYSHFAVPVVVVVVLWIRDRVDWIRFMRRFATVLAIACAGFVLLPTAPPWMAGGGDRSIQLDALPSLARPAGRGWQHLGLGSFLHAWEHGRDWVNRVAAMPSLHAAFSLMVVVYFFPRIRRRWVRTLLLLHPLVMGISLVYLAEHYVVDVLAGWAVVGISFFVWHHIERRIRARRASIARVAFDPPLPTDSSEPHDGTRRSVLLDQNVIAAAHDVAHVAHDPARHVFAGLIDEYEIGSTRLWMRAGDRDQLRSRLGSEPTAALTAACRIAPDGQGAIRRARRAVRRGDGTPGDERAAIARAIMEQHRIDEYVVLDASVSSAVDVLETD